MHPFYWCREGRQGQVLGSYAMAYGGLCRKSWRNTSKVHCCASGYFTGHTTIKTTMGKAYNTYSVYFLYSFSYLLTPPPQSIHIVWHSPFYMKWQDYPFPTDTCCQLGLDYSNPEGEPRPQRLAVWPYKILPKIISRERMPNLYSQKELSDHNCPSSVVINDAEGPRKLLRVVVY